jgi:hypothetical protein
MKTGGKSYVRTERKWPATRRKQTSVACDFGTGNAGVGVDLLTVIGEFLQLGEGGDNCE